MPVHKGLSIINTWIGRCSSVGRASFKGTSLVQLYVAQGVNLSIAKFEYGYKIKTRKMLMKLNILANIEDLRETKGIAADFLTLGYP